MSKRKRLSKRSSMCNFTRTARKLARKNIKKNLSRGGYSL